MGESSVLIVIRAQTNFHLSLRNNLIKELTMKFAYLFAILLCSSLVLAQSVIGSFRFVKETDPLNDQDRSYIWTQETRDRERAGQLQFRCQENAQTKQTDLYVALQHGLAELRYDREKTQVRVQYRLDGQPASSNGLTYFSEDRARVYIADDVLKALVTGAQSAQKVTVVLTNAELSPQTYIFNLQEFTTALRKLKCRVQK
jgi:hypothetical protein